MNINTITNQSVPVLESPLANLPEELLEKIFSYLDSEDLKQVELVNLQFRRIIYYPEIKDFENTKWKQVSNIIFTEKYFGQLIRKLDLQNCQLDNVNLVSLLKNCPFLKRLSICSAGIDTSTLTNLIANHCHQLEELKLFGAATGNDFTDDDLLKLSSSLKHVKVFELHSATLTGSCLPTIFKFSHLEKLAFTSCQYLTDSHITNSALQLTHLKELSFKNLKITGKCLQAIGRFCHQIEKLTFDSIELDFAGLNLATGALPNLREISFSKCSIRGWSIQNLNLAFLKKVSFVDCDLSDQSISAFASSLTHVRELTISGCEEITGTSFGLLGNHCNKLRKVDFSNCVNLSNGNLVSLAPALKNVTAICLDFCASLTGANFKKFGEHCERLEKVSLADCHLQERYLFQIIDETKRYPEGHQMADQMRRVFGKFIKETHPELVQNISEEAREKRIYELTEEHLESLETDDEDAENRSKRSKYEAGYFQDSQNSNDSF